MKIGILCYPTYGGSGVVATELGRFLARRGHEVHFISSEMPFRLNHEADERIIFHEVQSFSYPVLSSELYTLSLASKVVEIAQNFGLEVVHAHYAIPHAVSAWIARDSLTGEGHRRLPFVTTLHGTDITLVGRAPSYQPVIRHSLRESDAITAVSDWLARETIEHFTPAKPVSVIPNFVDTEKFRPNLTPCKRSRFAPEGEKLLVHISNFRPVKRVGDVVEVFANVQSEMPAKLLLIGDGPEREFALQRARELRVHQHVHFLGKQEQIEVFFSCADLLLLPSEYESFGLAALEAMSSQVTVITSDGGGLPEVIRHGETGFLAPVGDVDRMTELAIDALDDDPLRARIGRAARADVLARFTPEAIVPKYEELYAQLIGADYNI